MRRGAMFGLVAGISALVVLAAALLLIDREVDGPLRTTTTATTTTTSSTSSASLSTTTTSPTSGSTLSRGPAVVVRKGSEDRAVVALTFDAGSDTGAAAPILDRLRANGISASFGITGVWAEANPELVARMAAEGHQLLNHSWDHTSFTGRSTNEAPLSTEQRLEELVRAEAAIEAASGTSALPWFRPPYGDEDESVRADVGSAGYRYEALWTVDSLGWTGLDAPAVAARCLEGAEPGVIYLLHVGAASTDVDALQPLIDGLRQEGYGFVTLADLVAS